MSPRIKQTHNLLTSPGTLKYLGRPVSGATSIQKVNYTASQYNIDTLSSLTQLSKLEPTPSISWLHFNGVHEQSFIEQLGKQFDLHPLIQENIMNTYHKPLVESYRDDQLFITIKALYPDEQSDEFKTEQVSFVLTPTVLLSFQEFQEESIFEPILERIKRPVSRTRTMGADYLLYTLLDMIIDHYFITVDSLEDKLMDLEEIVIEDKPQNKLTNIYRLKREITLVRRTITPVREIINQLMRNESPLLTDKAQPYFHDLYNHIIQLTEMLDNARDVIASLVDVHLSTLSNRMNQTMKTLTIFSVIFLPITFIVGVYGMNFPHMPEFEIPYAYYGVWGLMIGITAVLIGFFKWKKWM